MKLFNFDKKTGRYEFRLTGQLDEIHKRALFAAKENQCLTYELLNAIFAEDAPGQDRQERENNVHQVSCDVMCYLNHLGLVKYEHDKGVSDWDPQTRKYINPRKMNGYFLAENGKALVDMLESKQKEK